MYSYYPFCPHPDCSLYRMTHKAVAKRYPIGWYVKNGRHFTKAHGAVQRFKCRCCGRTFSDQTFSTEYYTKRKISLEQIMQQLSSCTSIRAMSRVCACSRPTIDNRIMRLSHQCIASHARLFSKASCSSAVVMDGFESYVLSKYHPNNITIAVDESSLFFYTFSYTYMHRKGRMTEQQKAAAAQLSRRYPIAAGHIEHTARLMLRQLKTGNHTTRNIRTIISDEKREYVIPIRQVFPGVIHQRESSHTRRDTRNPLFPVNYADREFRKDLAEHVRRTLCHGRAVVQQLERMSIYHFWHNYLKPFRVTDYRAGKDDTHAHRIGIPQSRLDAEKKTLFKRREFFQRIKLMLNPTQKQIWLRRYKTPGGWGSPYYPQYCLD